jgi:hypothetical protein
VLIKKCTIIIKKVFGDKFRICIQICENPNVLGLQVFGLRVRFKANPLNLTTHYVKAILGDGFRVVTFQYTPKYKYFKIPIQGCLCVWLMV